MFRGTMYLKCGAEQDELSPGAGRHWNQSGPRGCVFTCQWQSCRCFDIDLLSSGWILHYSCGKRVLRGFNY